MKPPPIPSVLPPADPDGPPIAWPSVQGEDGLLTGLEACAVFRPCGRMVLAIHMYPEALRRLVYQAWSVSEADVSYHVRRVFPADDHCLLQLACLKPGALPPKVKAGAPPQPVLPVVVAETTQLTPISRDLWGILVAQDVCDLFVVHWTGRPPAAATQGRARFPQLGVLHFVAGLHDMDSSHGALRSRRVVHALFRAGKGPTAA